MPMTAEETLKTVGEEFSAIADAIAPHLEGIAASGRAGEKPLTQGQAIELVMSLYKALKEARRRIDSKLSATKKP